MPAALRVLLAYPEEYGLRSSQLTFPLPNLDSTLSVLSAMITPAVMILATSSLILTTTNRLVRIVDRVREMLPKFEKLVHAEAAG